MFHSQELAGAIHIINQFSYANATARLAATLLSTDIGKVAVETDTMNYFILQNNSPLTWTQISGAGSGQGGINYITNPSAASATTGWNTYANTPGPTPVNGTGGSPTVTIGTTNSPSLRGLQSFIFTKGAANDQGQGVSTDFMIDFIDQGTVQNISFDYLASGSFAFSSGSLGSPSDLEVFMYDITNAVLIPVSVNVITAVKGTFQASFQANSNSQNYRLIFHVATTNASAWTFEFTNVSVGPASTASIGGQPLVAMRASSPSSSLTGTFTDATGWAGVGQDTANAFNPTTGVYTVPISGTYYSSCSILTAGVTAATNNSVQLALAINGGQYLTNITRTNTSEDAYMVQVNTTIECIAGDQLKLQATAPTPNSGYAGGSQYNQWSLFLIDPTVAVAPSGQIVALSAYNVSNQVFTSSSPVQITGWTNIYDTAGSFAPSTGLYTVPVSGYYGVACTLQFPVEAWAVNTALIMYLFQNGSDATTQQMEAYFSPVSTVTAGSGRNVELHGYTELFCTAGDTLAIALANTDGNGHQLQSGSSSNSLYISMIEPPASLAAANGYIAPTVQSFLSGSGTYILPSLPRKPLYIEVTMAGGGGGGSSNGGAAGGGTGTDSTFGTSLLTAAGAAGGIPSFSGPGGQGGSATVNSPAIQIIAVSGAYGGNHYSSVDGNASGGPGGANPLGGAGGSPGAATPGIAGIANTGAGGSGGAGQGTGAGQVPGAGGGAGGYLQAIISTLSSTYSYSVGTGGAGGVGNLTGGNGGSGIIIVKEFYQ